MTGGGSTRRLRAEFWAIGTVLTTLVLTAWNGMLAFRADRASASLILGAAIGSLLLAAAVNGVAWLASRGARRTRTAAVRVALAAGIAVAAYGLLRELTASANVSTLVRIARFASPVLAGAVWGSFLDPLLRRHARRVLRRRRSPGRSLWAPLTGLALLIAGATAVIGLRGGTGEEGALLREGVRPTRRLWIVGVDGIDQRGLARWVALNSQSAIGRLALAGASAYVAWDAEGGPGGRRSFGVSRGRRIPWGPPGARRVPPGGKRVSVRCGAGHARAPRRTRGSDPRSGRSPSAPDFGPCHWASTARWPRRRAYRCRTPRTPGPGTSGRGARGADHRAPRRPGPSVGATALDGLASGRDPDGPRGGTPAGVRRPRRGHRRGVAGSLLRAGGVARRFLDRP